MVKRAGMKGWSVAFQKTETQDGRRSSSSSTSALRADQTGVRNRSPSKMTKYVECWGADKPFANITESTLAKNIGLTVSVPAVRKTNLRICWYDIRKC